MFRYLSATVALTLLPLLTHAAEVRIDAVNGAPRITVTPQADEGISVFQRFDDVWIVADKETRLTIAARPQSYQGSENLQVTNGKGIRLRFSQLPELGVGKQGNSFVVAQGAGAPDATLQTKDIDGGVLIARNGLANAARATSIDTRESYIALTRKNDGGEPQARVVNDVRLLRSLVGIAAVAEAGLPLSYQTNPQGFELKPMRTPLTTAVGRGARNVAPAIAERAVPRRRAMRAAPLAPVATPAVRPTFVPRGAGVDYSIAVSDILNRYGRSSSADAMSRMDAALAAIDGLRLRPALSADVLAELDDMIDRVVMPKALPEHTILTDYGDRSAADLSRIERRYLDRLLAAKTPDERDAATFELARIQFFLGRFPEVVGLTGTMQRGEGKFKNLPKNEAARLLLAAAQLHINRADEAAATLASLDRPSVERSLWEAALAGLQGKHEESVEKFPKNLEVASAYPRQTQQWLRYQYAHSLFALNKLEEALAEVDKLSVIDGRGYVLPMAQLLLGRIYEAMNEPAIAEQVYVNLSSHPNQVVANRALYHFLRLLHDRGELLGDAAIMRFENLRFMWRGDDVERDTLFLLGKMYLQENRMRDALTRLKYLNENFPEAPQIREATDMMTRAFSDVFIRGVQDETLDPLAVVALYYEFRELTPPGREGDQLINEVVRRLSALALYDRAIEMLEEQLAYRLKDADVRAEAGWHLARLYGLNSNPEKGIEALKTTATAAVIPTDIVNKRLYVMAELLLQQQKYEEAFKSLDKVPGKEAAQLRGTIALEMDKPADAIAALAPLYAEGMGTGTDWQADDIAGFTRYAMALAQQRNAAALGQLAERYRNGIIQHQLEPQMAFLLELAGSPQEVGRADSVNPWYRSYESMKQYNALEGRYQELQKNWDRVKRVDLDKLRAPRRR